MKKVGSGMKEDVEHESFVFYKSFFEVIEAMKDAERQVRAYRLIMRYALYGEVPDAQDFALKGAQQDELLHALFILAKPLLDANRRHQSAGKKGGRPRKEKRTEPTTPLEDKTGSLFVDEETMQRLKAEAIANAKNERRRANE